MNTINIVLLAYFPMYSSFNYFTGFFDGESVENAQVFRIFRRMSWDSSSFLFCLLIDVEEFSPGTIVKNSPQENFCPYILSRTGEGMIIRGGTFINFPSHAFIFARNAEHCQRKISSAIKSGFYKPRIPTVIILTTVVRNLDFLPGFMSQLWQLKLYRFNVILFQRNMQVFTYNPFLQLIINITNSSDISTTNDEFSNLHGYKLRLALYETPPDCYKENDEWNGREKFYWDNLLKDLNATIGVTETMPYCLKDAKRKVRDGVVDLCPLRYFRTDYPEDLEFSAPYFIESLVVLVPYSGKLVHAAPGFSQTVWYYLIGAILLVFLGILAIEIISPSAEGRDGINFFLDVLGISVGRTIVYSMYKRYNWLQKGLLMLWQLENVVLIAAFECALISTLLLAKFGDQINTLNDLVDTKLTIYVLPEYVGMVAHFSPNLENQIVEIDRRLLPALIEAHLNNKAIALPDSESHYFLSVLNQNPEELQYRVMDETLLPGFFSFFFTRHSPFVKIIDKKVLWKHQFGLNRKTKVRLERTSASSRSRRAYTPLSLKIFVDLFRAGLICLSLSIVTFLLEMFMHKKIFNIIS